MSHQQKLFYTLGLLIMGVAILVGIHKLKSSDEEANVKALTLDLMDIAAKIQAYYFQPKLLGGGDHSFSGLTSDEDGLTKLFIKSQNINGTFKFVNSGNDDFMIIRATGKNDYDGDGKNLTIEVKVYPDSMETVVVNYQGG